MLCTVQTLILHYDNNADFLCVGCPGAEQTRCGIQILHFTHDTTVRDCIFESSLSEEQAEEAAQQIGIEVGPEPQRTVLEGNLFNNMVTNVRYTAAAAL